MGRPVNMTERFGHQPNVKGATPSTRPEHQELHGNDNFLTKTFGVVPRMTRPCFPATMNNGPAVRLGAK